MAAQGQHITPSRRGGGVGRAGGAKGKAGRLGHGPM